MRCELSSFRAAIRGVLQCTFPITPILFLFKRTHCLPVGRRHPPRSLQRRQKLRTSATLTAGQGWRCHIRLRRRPTNGGTHPLRLPHERAVGGAIERTVASLVLASRAHQNGHLRPRECGMFVTPRWPRRRCRSSCRRERRRVGWRCCGVIAQLLIFFTGRHRRRSRRRWRYRYSRPRRWCYGTLWRRCCSLI